MFGPFGSLFGKKLSNTFNEKCLPTYSTDLIVIIMEFILAIGSGLFTSYLKRRSPKKQSVTGVIFMYFLLFMCFIFRVLIFTTMGQVANIDPEEILDDDLKETASKNVLLNIYRKISLFFYKITKIRKPSYLCMIPIQITLFIPSILFAYFKKFNFTVSAILEFFFWGWIFIYRSFTLGLLN